jgi:hypothetical protein
MGTPRINITIHQQDRASSFADLTMGSTSCLMPVGQKRAANSSRPSGLLEVYTDGGVASPLVASAEISM